MMRLETNYRTPHREKLQLQVARRAGIRISDAELNDGCAVSPNKTR